MLTSILSSETSGKIHSGAILQRKLHRSVLSRGFVYVKENEDIIDETQNLVREILSTNSLAGDNWPDLKNIIKDDVHQFIFEKINRNPMILPIILEI